MADAFDVEAAHRKFAAECFNLSWKLIDKAERTPADDVTLVALAQTSLWHWMQRADCTSKNLSIAHWLLSRVYCLTARPTEALQHAVLALDFAQKPGIPPFALAYAHEACARAASLLGDRAKAQEHRRDAETLGGDLGEDDRKRLLGDLATIPG